MVRRNRSTKSIPQKSKRSNPKLFKYEPDEDILLKKFQEKYISHQTILESSKHTRHQLSDFVGEECLIRGIILDITYNPEKALFLKQITLGSVTVTGLNGVETDIDHINIPIEITIADKIGPSVLRKGARIQFQSTVRFYNKKAEGIISTRKFKKDKTNISVGFVKDVKLINYRSKTQPLTLYLKNRIDLWNLNPKERRKMDVYVKQLPNTGQREDFVQAVSTTKKGHQFVDYAKLRYYMKFKPDPQIERILKRNFNYQTIPPLPQKIINEYKR